MAAHQHCAGAAKPHAAAILGAFQVQRVAQHPQEGHIRRHVHRGDYVVDFQFDEHLFTPQSGKGERIGDEHRLEIGVYQISALEFHREAAPNGNLDSKKD